MKILELSPAKTLSWGGYTWRVEVAEIFGQFGHVGLKLETYQCEEHHMDTNHIPNSVYQLKPVKKPGLRAAAAAYKKAQADRKKARAAYEKAEADLKAAHNAYLRADEALGRARDDVVNAAGA